MVSGRAVMIWPTCVSRNWITDSIISRSCSSTTPSLAASSTEETADRRGEDQIADAIDCLVKPDAFVVSLKIVTELGAREIAQRICKRRKEQRCQRGGCDGGDREPEGGHTQFGFWNVDFGCCK